MTTTEAKEILARAFAALPREQRENLRWHAEQGTGICCKRSSGSYYEKGKA